MNGNSQHTGRFNIFIFVAGGLSRAVELIIDLGALGEITVALA